MFTAYSVGVKIGVIDATAGTILKVAAQFTKADKAGKGFLATLEKINAELGKTRQGFGDAAADGFKRASRAAGDYERAASRAASAGQRGGGYSPFLLAAAASGGGTRGNGDGNGGGPLLLGGPGGGGAMSAGGMPWPKDFGAGRFRGGGGGGSGGGAGGGINMGAIAGGFALFQGGEAALGMLGSTVHSSSAYQQAQARFRQFGLSDSQNAEAFALSKNLGVAGASYTQALDNITEAQGVFRESGLKEGDALAGAKMAAPLLAKMSFAASSLDETTQAKMHTSELAALRFAEMRGGLKSPEAFNGIMDQAWKAIRSSGGNVDFEQYRQFMARGGVAASGLSDRALYGELEPIIGELKGSTAGNALMTSYNRLTGAVRIPNQVAHMLADSGVWDKSKIRWNSQGGIKSFNGNPLGGANMALMSADPVKFYHDVIAPMYAKQGIRSAADVARENTMIFGRTGGQFYNLIAKQYEQTQMSADAQGKAKGIDGAVGDAAATYEGNMKAFSAAWENFKIEFGNQALPLLTSGLKILTPLLSSAAKFMGEHGAITSGLVVMLGAIGGLALVAGPIVMIGGAFTTIAGIVVGGGLAAGLAGAAAGLVAIAGAAAAVYNLSDKYISGTKAGDLIGEGAAYLMSPFSQEARDAIARTNQASVTDGPAYGKPGAQGQTIQVKSSVHLDNRKVGNAMTTHIVNGMAGPMTGLSTMDYSQGATPIAVNYGN